VICKVREITADILPSIIRLRHSIHSEPEIGLGTVGTRQKVADALRNTSLEAWPSLMGGDFIAELKGRSKRVMCLRADMDALPIEERTGVPYSSTIPGAMHACGHDGHTAILVGAARVLNELREHLPVTVRFVFQPGEEVECGGKTLVNLGCCDNAEAAFALHGWPGLPTGQISSRPGALFAAAAQFSIRLTGKGCHGATPEKGVNPIPAAAWVVHRLGELHVALNALDGSVISVCSIDSGRSSNIVPDEAVIRGTTRYLDDEAGMHIERTIGEVVSEVARKFMVKAEMEYDKRYRLPVMNSTKGFEYVSKTAKHFFPSGTWAEASRPTMVCEDFAFYLENREGAAFFLGLGEDWPGLHTQEYDFNDAVIESGIHMFSFLALGYEI